MCLRALSPQQLMYNNVLNPKEIYFLMTRVILSKLKKKQRFGDLSMQLLTTVWFQIMFFFYKFSFSSTKSILTPTKGRPCPSSCLFSVLFLQLVYQQNATEMYTVCHTFTSTGQFNITLRCYNRYSYFNITKVIYVQIPVINFTVTVNATYFPYKDPIGLQYQFDNGTDVGVVAVISGV